MQQGYYPQAPLPYYDPYGALNQLQQYNPNNQNMMQNPQQPLPQSQEKPKFVYRPIGNIEEAKAAQIDWDGTVYFFEDKATGKIYRKQYVNDTVSFLAYEATPIPEPQPLPQYVTIETLEALTAEIDKLKGLSTEMDEIKKLLA